MTLLATGVPEVCDAYELTPRGAQPIRHVRVAGGLAVTLDEFGLTAQILLAHDPSIVGEVHRRAEADRAPRAELHRHLAAHKMNTVQALAERLASRTPRRTGRVVAREARREPASVRRATGGRRCGWRRAQCPARRADRCD